MGRSYFIGRFTDNHIMLDLMYADPFIRAAEIIDGIRMASANRHRSNEDEWHFALWTKFLIDEVLQS